MRWQEPNASPGGMQLLSRSGPRRKQNVAPGNQLPLWASVVSRRLTPSYCLNVTVFEPQVKETENYSPQCAVFLLISLSEALALAPSHFPSSLILNIATSLENFLARPVVLSILQVPGLPFLLHRSFGTLVLFASCYCWFCLRQDLSVQSLLSWDLFCSVDQNGLDLTEIPSLLPPSCWE